MDDINHQNMDGLLNIVLHSKHPSKTSLIIINSYKIPIKNPKT
jgi:hypothetical protein